MQGGMTKTRFSTNISLYLDAIQDTAILLLIMADQ